MPVYKDEARGTWYCKFYYTDWTGEKKAKLKRGFKLQREAKEWERDFLERQQANPNMTFKALYDLYIEDMGHRLKLNTLNNKKAIMAQRIVPYFESKAISDIKPTDIRKWQNALKGYTDDKREGYSETYLKYLHSQLSAIFNYAVKYYGLKENPCHKAGSMGKTKAKEMQIWTIDEFNAFIRCVNRPDLQMAFKILFWTGIRLGELRALTFADIDLNAKTLTVNKSFQRIDKTDIVTDPKTPKSNRVVLLPDVLVADLKEYMAKLYDICPTERIFAFSKSGIYPDMKKACVAAGVKEIRVHDIRHSHASLLIELGASPLLISERLGHENIETTLNIYSHLYPNKQAEIIEKLNKL